MTAKPERRRRVLQASGKEGYCTHQAKKGIASIRQRRVCSIGLGTIETLGRKGGGRRNLSRGLPKFPSRTTVNYRKGAARNTIRGFLEILFIALEMNFSHYGSTASSWREEEEEERRKYGISKRNR